MMWRTNHQVGGDTTRPVLKDGSSEELCETPRPKVWTGDQK